MAFYGTFFLRNPSTIQTNGNKQAHHQNIWNHLDIPMCQTFYARFWCHEPCIRFHALHCKTLGYHGCVALPPVEFAGSRMWRVATENSKKNYIATFTSSFCIFLPQTYKTSPKIIPGLVDLCLKNKLGSLDVHLFFTRWICRHEVHPIGELTISFGQDPDWSHCHTKSLPTFSGIVHAASPNED